MPDSIIYFFDPICSWCYGFSTHFYTFFQKHREDYDLQVITGGMVRSENARPIGEIGEYLKEAFNRVREMSGAQFGEPFLQRLEEGSTVFGSDVASLVYHTLAAKLPDRSIEVARAIQRAIYLDGIDPLDVEAYLPVCKQFGLDRKEFLESVSGKEVQDLYEADLYTTQQFGISGFPFVVVKLDDEYYQVARGFRTSDELDTILGKATEYHSNK